MLKLVRRFGIILINSLPLKLKWLIHSTSFFKKRLSFNNQKIRNRLFNSNVKLIIVGANDGLSFDDLFQSLDPALVSGLVVEPSPKYFELLRGNLKNFTGLRFFNCAINVDSTKLNLYQLNETGLSKLPSWGKGIGSLSVDHLMKFDRIELDDIEILEVEGIHFMQLIQDNPTFREIDYLQIDTEGFDAEIIKMIDFTQFYVQIIKFEWVNINIREQEDVLKIFESNGYFCFRDKSDMVALNKRGNIFFE